jgi:lysophospholipase L1-like esterase
MTIVLLALAELGARLFAPPPPAPYVHHPLLGPGWAPNYSFERLSIDDPPVVFTLQVNPLGFRGKRMRTLDKPKGAYRIFFLGASTVENALLPEERTFPGRVDDALNDRFKGAPPVEVANTGVAGTGIEFTTGMLTDRVLPLEPDLCVFLVGHNVYFETLHAEWDPRSAPQPEPPPTFKDWLSGASRLVALLDARKRAKTAREDNKTGWYQSHREDRHKLPFTPPRLDILRGLPYFKQCLRRLAVICKDAGCACAFMTQPALYKGSMKPEEEAALLGVVTKDPEQNLETPIIKMGMDAYNQAVRDVAKEQGVILIDAAEAVPRDLAHFVDDVHLTSKGNEDEAKAVLGAILGADGKLPHVP